MLTFIYNQANWYKEKSISFERVRIEMLRQTKEGQYRLALRRDKAISIFNSILGMANDIQCAYNPSYEDSEHYKKIMEINKSMNELHQLDLKFKRKQVYPDGGYSGNHTDIRYGIPGDEFIVTNERQKQMFKDFHLKNSESIIQPKQTKKQ